MSQLEHALQTAHLAEREGASAALITAALLHDVGHLLHDLPLDAPDRGIDDRHENSAFNYLAQAFPAEVTQPIRLHVAAKRYLCAAEPGYMELLSVPSVTSLELQGGPMSREEAAQFRQNLHHETAIRLRRWDDAAKDPAMKTPSLNHFTQYVERAIVPDESQ